MSPPSVKHTKILHAEVGPVRLEVEALGYKKLPVRRQLYMCCCNPCRRRTARADELVGRQFRKFSGVECLDDMRRPPMRELSRSLLVSHQHLRLNSRNPGIHCESLE